MNFYRFLSLITGQLFTTLVSISLLLAGCYFDIFYHWNIFPFIASSIGISLLSGMLDYRKSKSQNEHIEVLSQKRSVLIGFAIGSTLILISFVQKIMPWYVLVVPSLFVGFAIGAKLNTSNK